MAGWGGGSTYSANQFIPIGTPSGASGYEQQRVLELQRQAELMDQQLNQAGSTTSAMQTQALGGQSSLGNLSGSSSSLGSISSGSYTQPGTGGGMTSYGGAGGLSGGVPTGASSGALSTAVQQQFDPWSQYRAQAGTQLAGEMGQDSPSSIYQQKLAEMANGTFSPDVPS